MIQSLLLSRVLRSEAGWYRGDLHAHTTHSDGHLSTQELAGAAKAEVLDFLAVTDHNSIGAYPHFGKQPDLLVLPGLEATFHEGHFNILGLEEWSGWMDTVCQNKPGASLDGQFASLNDWLKETAGEGLINSLNHPLLSPWECRDGSLDLRLLDCLEIWNDPSWPANEQSNPDAVELWTSMLNAGHRLTAVGGSDYHKPVPNLRKQSGAERLGRPATFVYATALSGKAIMAGLRQGRAYVSMGPAVSFQARQEGQLYQIGDALRSVAGTVTFSAELVDHTTPCAARLVKNGETLAEKRFQPGEHARLQLADSLLADETGWYRLDVLTAEGQMQIITNPIFLGPRRLPERNRFDDFVPGAASN